MRFLSVRELRGNSARVWAELPKEREMVVTNNRASEMFPDIHPRVVEEAFDCCELPGYQ